MKRFFVAFFIIITVLLLSSYKAEAVKAYPDPITITQPDGSKLTIRVHGDEFLGWTTCNGALVSKGKDGYYYYASFNPDGSIKRSNDRVGSSKIRQSSIVRPPKAAYDKAYQLRRSIQNTKINTARPNSGTQITRGNNKFLVLLIEFSDLKFTVPEANTAFSNMLNQQGYAENSATGSARDYYMENSNNIFQPQYDVVGPISVSKGYAYYSEGKGQGTPGAKDLLVEACTLADNMIDFSQYDIDGDGTIDNIFFYFAGHNMAEGAEGHIWPHKWAVFSGQHFDGKLLYGYACTSEYRGNTGTSMCGIGTFCHEFGHALGLPDFYDTNFEDDGDALALGDYSLMSSGNYNNSGRTPPYLNFIERNILSWADDPAELTVSGDYTLEPVNNNKAYFTPTLNKGEYFIYENRQNLGWDQYLPGHGMLIYHIDKSKNMVNGYSAESRWLYGYGINANADHQCCDLIEAVYPESKVSDQSQIPFPGANKVTSFTDATSPSAVAWSGHATGYNIKNIAESGSTVSFTLDIDKSKKLSGYVYNSDYQPIEGAKVVLKIKSATTANIKGRMHSSPVLNNNQEEISCITDKKGKYTVSSEIGNLFTVEVSCKGYNAYSADINMPVHGTYDNDFLLSYTDEIDYEILKKYNNSIYNQYIGNGEDLSTYYVSALFSADELKSKVGKKIKNISFMIKGSSANEVKVFVYYDNACVFTQNVPKPNFGSVTNVDIQSAKLTVPSGKSVRVGYYLSRCDEVYPVICDSGPNEKGGLEISYDGTSWEDCYSLYGLNYNARISFSMYSDSNIFGNMGYICIGGAKSTYTAGETFAFELTSGSKTPASVKWYFDGVEQTSNGVVLTAGDHVIKAELTYSDGGHETLLKEIQVR